MNSTEIRAYKCEKCGSRYTEKLTADRCCSIKHCAECGVELPYKCYANVCENCQAKREFNRGKVLTIGEFLKSEYKDNMVYYNGEYFADIDSCLDTLWDNEELYEVKYVKATYKYLHELDADSLIEELEYNTNCEDDLYVEKEGVKELEEFLKVWNEKYRLTTYGEINVYIEIDDKIKEEYR